MKSIQVLAAAALLTLAVGATTNAAKLEITPAVNLSLPMGDFGDFAKLGFGGSGALDFFVAPAFSIGGLISYTTYSSEFDGADAVGVMEFGGRGRYHFGPTVANAFFLEGTAGIHSYSGSGDGSDFGFGFGAGKRFPMGTSGKTTLVPEVLYYIVPGDVADATFIMFRLGLGIGAGSTVE